MEDPTAAMLLQNVIIAGMKNLNDASSVPFISRKKGNKREILRDMTSRRETINKTYPVPHIMLLSPYQPGKISCSRLTLSWGISGAEIIQHSVLFIDIITGEAETERRRHFE